MTVAEPPALHARIDPRLAPELAGPAVRTQPFLARVLGEAADRVTVEWEPAEAGDEPAVRVRLTEAGVSRSAVLTGFDLGDELRTQWRLLRLWCGVLDEHLGRRWAAVRSSLAADGE